MKKKVKVFLIMLLAVFASSLMANAQSSGDDVLGKWTNEDETRVLEFVKVGESYEAIIKEAPEQNLIGKKQLTGLEFKKGVYKGKLYLPKRDKTLGCSLKILSDGRLELTVKAGLMSKSQTWTRVN